MVSKNGEARKCANTNRASIENNRIGNIDMNIVAKSDLNFHGIQLQPVANLDGVWLTASQIGFALEYADDKAVQRIYTRHADEFTEQMTGVVKVTTPYGEQMTRAFTLRGAHLIAMFARTPVAKEFRRWVLDILDRESERDEVSPVAQKLYSLSFTEDEMCSLAWLLKAATHLRDDAEKVSDALEPLNSNLITGMGLMATHYKQVIDDSREVLKREISANAGSELNSVNWQRALSTLMVH